MVLDFTAARIRVMKRIRHHTKVFPATANTSCLLPLHGKAEVLRDTEIQKFEGQINFSSDTYGYNKE